MDGVWIMSRLLQKIKNKARVEIDCNKCKDKLCCTHVIVKLDRKSFRIAKREDGVKYLELHNLVVTKTKKKNFLLKIPINCNWLTEDGSCKDWKNRPKTCQRNTIEFDETGGVLCPKEAIKEFIDGKQQ